MLLEQFPLLPVSLAQNRLQNVKVSAKLPKGVPHKTSALILGALLLWLRICGGMPAGTILLFMSTS